MDAIEVYRGDDWSLAFTYRNAAGAPIDLSGGYTVIGRLHPNAAAPIDLEGSAGQAVIVDAAAGKIAVLVTRDVTVDVTPDEDPFTRVQVILVDPSDEQRTIGLLPLVVKLP